MAREMKPTFHQNYQDAEIAYLQHKDTDPFPEIQPSLLNSADIYDYVQLTGMIYPFYKEDLKGATYDVRLKGLCVYYKEDANDDSLTKHIFCVGQDDTTMPHTEDNSRYYECKKELRLAPNSITFVTLEPVFQVPEYMALRFNLKISHVYKGLLLGTGPIIDPGFRGRLSIPLHNLTSKEYVFYENDPIITLEFTKMSPLPAQRVLSHELEQKHTGEYVPAKISPHRQVTTYLAKAIGENNGGGIVSSVIAANKKTERTAIDAKKMADEASKIANGMQEKLDKQGRTSLIIGIIAIIVSIAIALFTLALPSYQLINDVTIAQKGELTKQIDELNKRVAQLEDELSDEP